MLATTGDLNQTSVALDLDVDPFTFRFRIVVSQNYEERAFELLVAMLFDKCFALCHVIFMLRPASFTTSMTNSMFCHPSTVG